MTSVPSVRTRSVLLVAVAVAVAAVSVASASPAAADCSGPTLAFEPLEVGRGGEVTVAGTGFGDNCYDTGPPPAGQGFLGNPQRDIQVLLVQGEREALVAKGDADDGYAFEVTFVVPADLVPGEAQLLARLAGGGEGFTPQALLITDAAPIEGAEAAVVTFGEDDPEPGTASTAAGPADGEGDGADEASDDGGALLPIVGLVLVVAAVAACVLYPRWKLRSGTPTS